uniref:KRAB domain-containing protein n=1 Tax=Chelonoidis abingdonii TaxID=106734 RepID=A0A8C0GRS2_CHEAB
GPPDNLFLCFPRDKRSFPSGQLRCKIPTVAFEDVALYFTREEWELLSQPEKQLYQNQMLRNYRALVFLGKDQFPLFYSCLQPAAQGAPGSGRSRAARHLRVPPGQRAAAAPGSPGRSQVRKPPRRPGGPAAGDSTVQSCLERTRSRGGWGGEGTQGSWARGWGAAAGCGELPQGRGAHFRAAGAGSCCRTGGSARWKFCLGRETSLHRPWV